MQNNFLLEQILSAINSHITNVVDKRVQETLEAMVNHRLAEIMQNHHTLQWMNEDFERRVRTIAEEVADESVAQHEREEVHNSSDYIHDIALNVVRDTDFGEQIQMAVNHILRDDGYVDENRADDIVEAKIDEIDWDEKVKDAIRSIIANS